MRIDACRIRFLQSIDIRTCQMMYQRCISSGEKTVTEQQKLKDQCVKCRFHQKEDSFLSGPPYQTQPRMVRATHIFFAFVL